MTSISGGISNSSAWGTAPPRAEKHGGKAASSSLDDSSSATAWSSVDDLFGKLDADGDGSISASELGQGMKAQGHDSQGGQNAFGDMGLGTQGFAAMMGQANGMGGMPPPPPPPDSSSSFASDLSSAINALDSNSDGTISASEFGLDSGAASTSTLASSSSASSAQADLFKLIDSDQGGDLSAKEVSAFADKMKALFEQMQQMGAQASNTMQASSGGTLSVSA
jgi:Ca2+-binding EF-hand superfamily protein